MSATTADTALLVVTAVTAVSVAIAVTVMWTSLSHWCHNHWCPSAVTVSAVALLSAPLLSQCCAHRCLTAVGFLLCRFCFFKLSFWEVFVSPTRKWLSKCWVQNNWLIVSMLTYRSVFPYSIQDNGARLQAYWTIVNKLPRANLANLK